MSKCKMNHDVDTHDANVTTCRYCLRVLRAENAQLREALKRLLELDKNGYLHRDKLDTESDFKFARSLVKP